MSGGIAQFINAWMDGDENAKDRLMQMYKDATGVQSDLTRTQQTVQDIRLAEAGEQRKVQLAPIELRQAEATAGISESQRGTMERTEQEAVATNEYLREQLGGVILPQLTQLLAGLQVEEQTKILRARATQDYAKSVGQAEGIVAGEELQRQRAGIGTGEVTGSAAKITAQEELDRQTALRAGRTGETLGEAEGMEAKVRGQTAEFQERLTGGRLGTDIAKRMVRMEELSAETAELKAKTERDMAQYMENNNYANIAAEAETLYAGLKDDVAYSAIMAAQAKSGVKGLDAEMQIVREAIGEENFTKMLVRKNMQDAGMITSRNVYYDNIQKAEQHILSMQTQLQEGLSVEQTWFLQEMPEKTRIEILLGKQAKELSEVEMFGAMNGYIRTQKELLWEDWKEDYDTLANKDYSQLKISDEQIGMAIEFIENNRGLPGAIGNMLRGWPAGGWGVVDQATVMNTVNNIISVKGAKGEPTNPMEWGMILERNRADLLDPKSTWGTEADFNAVMTILNTLSMQITAPGTLAPTLPATGTETE